VDPMVPATTATLMHSFSYVSGRALDASQNAPGRGQRDVGGAIVRGRGFFPFFSFAWGRAAAARRPIQCSVCDDAVAASTPLFAQTLGPHGRRSRDATGPGAPLRSMPEDPPGQIRPAIPDDSWTSRRSIEGATCRMTKASREQLWPGQRRRRG